MARMIWKWSMSLNTTIDVREIGLGETIALQVTQVAADANNLLAPFLSHSGFSVQFAFICDDPTVKLRLQDETQPAFLGEDPTDDKLYQNQGSALSLPDYVSANCTAVTNLFAVPSIFNKADPVPQGREFSMQLYGRITIPFIKQPFYVSLSTLKLRQAPLPVPTIAIFFSEQNFQGNPLFFLPANTPDVGGRKWDDRDFSQLGLSGAEDVFAKVRSVVSFSAGALNVIEWFYSNDWGTLLQTALNSLRLMETIAC
jgi:hypothetical protein